MAAIAIGTSSTAAERDSAPPIPDDLDFCKEVLILHRSHVDVVFTHPPSMYWELQKGDLGNKPTTATLSLPGRAITQAQLCGMLEDNRSKRALAGTVASCELAPRQITTVRLLHK